jgi:hypothetical protein
MGLSVNAAASKIAWITWEELGVGPGDWTQNIRYANLDGSGEVTLLGPIAGVTVHNIRHCLVNTDDNKLWFEDLLDSAVTNVLSISKIPFTAGLTTGDIETVLRDDQADFAGYDMTFSVGLMFGCGQEAFGGSYSGGTQSSQL